MFFLLHFSPSFMAGWCSRLHGWDGVGWASPQPSQRLYACAHAHTYVCWLAGLLAGKWSSAEERALKEAVEDFKSARQTVDSALKRAEVGGGPASAGVPPAPPYGVQLLAYPR